MENRFEQYLTYKKENGVIVDINSEAFFTDDAFLLFKEMFDTDYGSIEEDGNLISIHSGGWSENESLIEEFKETAWWYRFHCITHRGGHYYFNTDINSINEWLIVNSNYKHPRHKPKN